MNNANITFGFFHTRKNEYLARGYVFGRGLTTAGDLRNENGEESEQSWVRCFPGSGHMEGTAMIERTCICQILVILMTFHVVDVG